MSCNSYTRTSEYDELKAVSSASLSAANAFVKEVKDMGMDPSVVAKSGPKSGWLSAAVDAGIRTYNGDFRGAITVIPSTYLGGAAAGKVLGLALTVPGAGVVGTIVLAGAASYVVSELTEKLSGLLFDPTIDPAFYVETLRNREQRLRDQGIDPDTDTVTQMIRRRYEKQRLRAGLPPSDCVIGEIKEKTQTASTIPSPIALDLDSDGVETLELNFGAHFDHAADGFAEMSGWVSGDDGLLARDLNDNGRIDSGRELFGSEAVLADGSKAANGFEALAELDGNGDGKIDASDSAFTTLHIWQDTDSNGRTDEGELLTLDEAGVQSISVSYINSSYVDANGNAHKQVGNYTTTDGLTRAATDVWVKTDATYSVPTEWVDVPEDIAALPDAQGYGKVRDLHQAMAMDATGELKTLVTAFTQTTAPEDHDALITEIIYRWTGVQDVNPTSRAARHIYGNAIGDARKLEALEEFMGEEWSGVWCWGEPDPNPHGRAAPVLLQAWDELKALVYGQLMAQSHQKGLFQRIQFQWDEELDGLVGDLSVVAEAFTNQIQTDRTMALINLGEFLHSLKSMGLMGSLSVEGFVASLRPLGEDVEHTLDVALTGWAATNSPTEYNDMLRGTEGRDRIDGLQGDDRLSGRSSGDILIGGEGDDALSGGEGSDTLRGGVGSDTYRFGRGDGHDITMEDSWLAGEVDRIELKADITTVDVRLERTGSRWWGDDNLRVTILDTGETLTVRNHFNQSNRHSVEEIVFADGTVWGTEEIKTRTLIGDARDNELRGFSNRDDMIDGGAGHDWLYGLSGNDTLIGGVGNDALSGSSGDDILDGGAGDDVLEGGSGSDTYYIGLGDGHDVIYEHRTPGSDVVELATGITPEDVTVRWTLQGDMAITLPESGRLIVDRQGWSESNELGIEQLHFADGTVWNRDTLALQASTGTEENDTILGSYQDDTFDGGAGNDRFQDQRGYDTYRFGIGDGQDAIEDSYGRVLFKSGIGQNDVTFARDGGDLIATVSTSGDAVRIKDWIYSWGRIDRFDFDNGAHLSEDDVLAKLNIGERSEILYGSPGDDVLTGTEKDSEVYGREGDDTLIGGAGDDELHGEAGNDVLRGGTGRDELYGGAGDDSLDGGAGRDELDGGDGANTYILVPGTGLDEVVASASTVADDTVLFGPGIQSEDISVQVGWHIPNDDPAAVGYEEMVVGIGGNDALVIRNRNRDDLGYGAIQRFRFADGKELSLAEMIARADGGEIGWQQRSWSQPITILGSQADDNIYDETSHSVTVQARGNDDYISINAGNDIVSAGSGRDYVSSRAGDDLISGERGEDFIDTGDGDDVIAFNYGDGYDEVAVGDGLDTLSFGATVTPAMLTAVLNGEGHVVLLVDSGAGGAITLFEPQDDDATGGLERLQFIDKDGKIRIFDFAGWLQASSAALVAATPEKPLAFDGAGFDLTGMVMPTGGLEAVAYAQTGDLFAQATFADNAPTDGDDVLHGTAASDLLDARAGNDMVMGEAGDDTVLGGAGNDLLHGGNGNDVLEGGAGDDLIYGGWGADQLTGGTGRDELYGEWGGDTYRYQAGDGEVTIDDDHRVIELGGGIIPTAMTLNGDMGYGNLFGDGDILIDDAPNILDIGPGIDPNDLRYSERAGDLVIEFANRPNDRVILRGYDASRTTRTRSVDVIRFADGAEIAANSIVPAGTTEVAGDEGGLLIGTPFADTLVGGAGNDLLEGEGGSDRLVGGAGSDTYVIYKEPGSPLTETVIHETWRAQDYNRIELLGDFNPDDLRLEFDGRDLLLRLSEAGDAVRFDSFDPRAPGMQAPISEITLSWQDISITFDDLLAQGVYYDGQTHDIYEVNVGDGEVVIDDVATPNAGNMLRFGLGIDPEDLRSNLRFEPDGNGGYWLIVPYGNEGDLVRFSGFNPEDVLGGDHAVERFEFADGTTLDYNTFVSNGFVVEGSAADNELTGTNLADRLYGGIGNDQIHGGAGRDELHSGQGNDVLYGEAGDDGYVFNRGDGIDTIIDSGEKDFNFIRFRAGIRPEDVRHEWDGTTLVLHYSGQDAIRVENYYSTVQGNPAILALAFEDGSFVSLTEQMNRAPVTSDDPEDSVAVEDQAYILELPTNLFIDPDASDQIHLSASLASGEALPEWLSFDPAAGTFRGTPGNRDVGTLEVLVKARDHFGKSTTASLHIVVQNTNDAPEVAVPIGDQQIAEDMPFTFTVPEDVFRDVDGGDTLTLTATQADGASLPAWLSFDAATRIFSGQPTNGDVGGVSIKLTATDEAGASASETFDLTVANVNDAPEVGVVLGDQAVRQGVVFDWQLPEDAFVDADAGDVLGYSASLVDGSPLPDWLAFDPATGHFTGTAPAAGRYDIRITATDLEGATAEQTFGFEVTGTTVPDTATVIEDRKLLAWGNVLSNDTDPEGEDLRVADPGVRFGEYGMLTLLSNGGYAYVLNDLSPEVQKLGASESVVDRFTYTASDGTTQENGELTVTVQGKNDRPRLAHRLADVQLAHGDAFSWQVPVDSFVDWDRNDALTYTATLGNGEPLPDWLQFDATTRTFSGAAPADAKGRVKIRVVAADGRGEGSKASDTFKIRFGNETVLPQDKEVTDSGSDAPLSEHGFNHNGSGAGFMQPGNQNRGARDDGLASFLDGFKPEGKAVQPSQPALDSQWFQRWRDKNSGSRHTGEQELSRTNEASIERHWSHLMRVLDKLDTERESLPAWQRPGQGADLSGLTGVLHGGSAMQRFGHDPVGLATGSSGLKGFVGLREGLAKSMG